MIRFLLAVTAFVVGCYTGVIAAAPGFNGADLALLICVVAFIWAAAPIARYVFSVVDDPDPNATSRLDRLDGVGAHRE